MSIFQGTATALITPLQNGKIDFESLEKLVAYQLANGVSALVVNGTTGEPTTMTHKERTAVARFVKEQANGKVPVIMGAGSNNTYTATEYATEAEALGADAILAVTPYYNKCTQAGVLAHYKTLADNVNIPIILYNVPGRTGVNIEPETALSLAGYRNIAAIKEASGNLTQYMRLAMLLEGKMDIYSGDDDLVYSLLALGGKGVISVASNIIPAYMSEMVASYFAGDAQKSRAMQFKAYPLIKALFSEVNPIPVKCAARLMGLIQTDEMRLPLTPHSKEESLKKELLAFGITL